MRRRLALLLFMLLIPVKCEADIPIPLRSPSIPSQPGNNDIRSHHQGGDHAEISLAL